MKKSFILGLTTGIVVTGASLALASSQIEAILNDQIKVSLDGQVQEFKDETTNETQYPITYKDRTYLPLRTVANLVGVGVDYDAETNTAILTTSKEEESGEEVLLKDNEEAAKVAIIAAMEQKIEEVFGDKVESAEVTVNRVYNSDDEVEIPDVESLNLGPNDVAFELSFDLLAKDAKDKEELAIPNGVIEEETNWVRNNGRIGILRFGEDGNYTIDSLGTAW